MKLAYLINIKVFEFSHYSLAVKKKRKFNLKKMKINKNEKLIETKSLLRKFLKY